MRALIKKTTPLFFAAALTISLFTAGCTVHAGTYDAYGNYHHWNDHEVVYYNQWEHDTHRNHVEYNKRKNEDQKAYWEWRHNHQ